MIDLMKFDMGGASATLGSAKAISLLKPANVKVIASSTMSGVVAHRNVSYALTVGGIVQVHFITASCENMVSGTGMRPGDILTASNGRTIEINNTDAEGRLTLADALVYAEKLGVQKVKVGSLCLLWISD